MIGMLNGIVDSVDIDSGTLILDCNGVGYEVYTNSFILVSNAIIGSELKLYIHTAVKEDAITLYGFNERNNLSAFKKLITVNGIGPKNALSILEIFDYNSLALAIMAGDDKAISKANGIGTKGAQKIILELKGKLTLNGLTTAVSAVNTANDSRHAAIRNDVLLSLEALGFNKTAAFNAVNTCEIGENDTASDVLDRVLPTLNIF